MWVHRVCTVQIFGTPDSIKRSKLVTERKQLLLVFELGLYVGLSISVCVVAQWLRPLPPLSHSVISLLVLPPCSPSLLSLPALQAYKEQELLRLVYFGGVDPSLRKEVWPFLLGHYQFGMSEDDRKEVGVPLAIGGHHQTPWSPTPDTCPVTLCRWMSRCGRATSRPWVSGWAARPSCGSGRRSSMLRHWLNARPSQPVWIIQALCRGCCTVTPVSAMRWHTHTHAHLPMCTHFLKHFTFYLTFI